MKPRIALLALLFLSVLVFMSTAAHLHGQQPSQASQHEEQHPGSDQATPAGGDQHAAMMHMMAMMQANDQKLDDLVKKMNAAKGNARVDVMAELLTTLVQDQKTMHESMASMPMMMNMTGSMETMHCGGDSNTSPKQ